MSVEWPEVIYEASRLFKLPVQNIVSKGLAKFIQEQISQNEQMIDNLKRTYAVSEHQELEEKIRSKKIPSHPAWEDLIAWEQTDEHLKRCRDLLKELDPDGE
ncbi:MAG: hypothetical protein H5U02_14870 [Clostridia bacterium]|nr:hypothetical protein [Clostridia bacterium]